MEETEVVILHCSDLHYGFEDTRQASPDDKRLRRERIDSFLEIIKEIPEGWQPDILVISGDIAWSGIKEEYEKFICEFLNPTLSRTGIEIENVILCIGNHDKDDMQSGYFGRPNDQTGTPDELHPDNLAPWLDNAFPAFLDACRWANIEKLANTVSYKITDGISSEVRERAGYVYGYRQMGGIDFLVLNSAWDCYHSREDGKTDYGLIRVGRQLVSDAINQIKKDGKERVVITVLHHPFHWLHPSDKKTINTIKTYSDIVLCGHEHEFDRESSKDCLILCSSTLSSNDTADFGFELIKIIYSPAGLPPRVRIMRGKSDEIENSVEWAWINNPKEEVLWKRNIIAECEDQLLDKISIAMNDIVVLTERYTYEKERFVAIYTKTTADAISVVDYQNDLFELEGIFNEINSKLNQLQSDLSVVLRIENVTIMQKKIHEMLSIIADLLLRLRTDPPSNRRNVPVEAIEPEQEESIKRTLRSNP